MRILVFSDTHYHTLDMKRVIKNHPEADMIIHLGDNERDAEEISSITDIPVKQVRGNNDFRPKAPISDTVICEDKKIFFTHGNRYIDYNGIEALVEAGRAEGADIILFGHTHMPFNKYKDGVFIFNPGSITQPRGGSQKSYGIIDIENSQIFMNVAELTRGGGMLR